MQNFSYCELAASGRTGLYVHQKKNKIKCVFHAVLSCSVQVL